MKEMAIKIETYHLMNILLKFNLTKIINLQNSDAWKIQLTIGINFISSKDAEKERVMHSSSSNIKFKPYSDTNVIDKRLKSLLSKYQDNLETSMKRSDFIFDSV